MEIFELTDDILPDELGDVGLSDFCLGFSLDSLSEIVNGDNCIAGTSLSFRKGAYEVYIPLCEGSRLDTTVSS